MSRDDATVLDLLKAARLAVEFMGDLDRDAFLDDLKTQSAVLHQLLLLGEGVKRLSNQFRSGHPRVPWRMVAGMRDKLVHAYDQVELEEVWKTIHTDVPSLITSLEPLASPPRFAEGEDRPISGVSGD